MSEPTKNGAVVMKKVRAKGGYLKPVEAPKEDTKRPDINIRTTSKDKVFKIAPIKCTNEWCFISPFMVESTLLVPMGSDYRNIGVVVGRNPKLVSANGTPYDNPLAIGTVVMFERNSVIQELNFNQEPYDGRRVVLLSQRNVICELPPITVEILDMEVAATGLGVTVKKKGN